MDIDPLTPHPILGLPDPKGKTQEELEKELSERREKIILERLDPFRYGFRPAIWDACDDLLKDGHQVIFDVSRAALLGAEIDVPREIVGRREMWIAGCQRSSKTEYAARKCVETFMSKDKTRGWSFADTATKSCAQQQPVFFKYLPFELREALGKKGRMRFGLDTNIVYNLKTGFSDNSLAFNGSSHWFKNYEQDVAIVEGDQLNIVWFDELRSVELLKTIRFRMGDRQGIIIATFTSINDRYADIDDEYLRGSQLVLESKAKLLPLHDENGIPTGDFERVPRVKIAGPGSDGDQKANVIYFHITDNPYYGFDSSRPNISAEKRFHEMIEGANREKILSRAYGILERSRSVRFPMFKDTVHIVKPEAIPKEGTNYHIVDPVEGRNWFMIWLRITPDENWYVYREWPTHSHKDALIPEFGDLGPWTLPSSSPDGKPGPAQTGLGFGLARYCHEIARLEEQEPIYERWMDSRYGHAPRMNEERTTTLIEQMEVHGMLFRAASGGSGGATRTPIKEGTDLINDKLFYDTTVPLADFSAKMNRLNWPKLFVSEHCPNLIFSLKEWTGLDGNKGACKDPVDCLRYAVAADLFYESLRIAWQSY